MKQSIACLFISALLLGSIAVDALAPTSTETSTTVRTTNTTAQTTTSLSNGGVTSCYTNDIANFLSAPVQKACAAGSTSCFKFTFSALGQSASIKGCTSNCLPGNGQGPNGVAGSFTCCSTDNCNSSLTLISNKILTGSSILIAIALAMFRLQ